MNIKLTQLRSFLAVARAGSFTRAAVALHLSQPALTVQIRELERELGFSLFERTTRSVQLTAAAHQLAQDLGGCLMRLDDLLERAQTSAQRTPEVIDIACIPSLAATILPRALAAFRQLEPHVEVRVRDLGWKEVLGTLRAGDVRLGIGATPYDDPDLETNLLADEPVYVVLPRGHELVRQSAVDIEVLSRHPLILTSASSSLRRTVKHHFDARQLLMLVAYDVAQFSSALGLVRADMGITLLPSFAIERENCRDLELRPIEGVSRRLVTLRQRGKRSVPAADLFASVLSKSLRETI